MEMVKRRSRKAYLRERESSPAESDSKWPFWTCTSEFRYGNAVYNGGNLPLTDQVERILFFKQSGTAHPSVSV